MITNISYRRAQLADLDALVGLELACFSSPWSEASLREDLEDPHKYYFVGETQSGAVVAYVGLSQVLDEGQINNVAVFPTWRAQGIGQALLEHMIEAMKNSVSVLYLEVRQSNQGAINLYKKLGFTIDGERKDFYTHPKEDAFLMSYHY